MKAFLGESDSTTRKYLEKIGKEMKILQIWNFVDDRYYRNEKMAQVWHKIGENDSFGAAWRNKCVSVQHLHP